MVVYTVGMKYPIFYRNIRAGEQLDIFLISAIGSLLLVRAFLYVTGFPQIGGGGLHIAHMLWGGLLLAAGVVIAVSFIGLHSQRLAALVGGIGFGIFIDELGKFITSDNDYFYKPAVGIIYAVFVILYLAFNFISRERKLTSREYQINALAQLEEAIVHDMDPHEKRRALDLLAQADHRSRLTNQLELLIGDVKMVPENPPHPLRRFVRRIDRAYMQFWLGRNTRPMVRTFFILETALFVGVVLYGIYNNLDDIAVVLNGAVTYDVWLFAGQFVSALVAAGFAVYGALLLKRSRSAAFEQFRRATLINLFLTEFFIFSRIEFEALAGFFFNLGILLLITYVIHQERRLGTADAA